MAENGAAGAPHRRQAPWYSTRLRRAQRWLGVRSRTPARRGARNSRDSIGRQSVCACQRPG
jgi:hypothetical protein